MRRCTTIGLLGIALLLQGLFAAPGRAQPGIDSQQVPQSVVNDLLRNNSQDFFRRGRERFEQQIRDLQEQQATPPGEVLKINPELTPTLEQQLNQLSIRTPHAILENPVK